MGQRLSSWAAGALAAALGHGPGGGSGEGAGEGVGEGAAAASSGNSSPAAAEEDPKVAAVSAGLRRAAAEVPGLLAYGRYADAHQALSRCLQSLDELGDLSKVELPVLRIVALTALLAVPSLPSESQSQLWLAFDGAGLAALVAKQATAKPELLARCRPLLLELSRAVASVWFFTPAIINQPLDNNRFVLMLCSELAELEGFDREVLAALAFGCVSAPKARIWASRYISSDVLLAFVNGAGAAPAAATAALAPELLRQGHAPATTTMVQRVLQFARAWEQKFSENEAMVDAWLQAAFALQPALNPAAALTPTACLIAFFLARKQEHGRRRGCAVDLRPWQGAAEWLRGGLHVRSTGSEALVIRGFVAAMVGPMVAAGQGQATWAAVAEATAALAFEVVLSPSVLRLGHAELRAHEHAPECQFVPTAASTLADCVAALPAAEHTRIVLMPLEHLCRQWSEGWDDTASTSSGLVRGLLSFSFGTALRLFVASVLRQVPHWDDVLGPEELLLFMRSLAFADIFRDAADEEHIAICNRLAEVGAERPGFAAELFRFVQAADGALLAAGSGGRPPEGKLRTLHFLLGAVAVEELIKMPDFFPAVWPVIVGCARRTCEGAWRDEAVPLAIRAQSLAALVFKFSGTAGRSDAIKAFATAATEGLRAAPEEHLRRALAGALGAAARDVAKRREREREQLDAEDDGLLDWALGYLSDACWDCLDAQPREDAAAEGLFQALAAVACSGEPDALPDFLYDRCRLRMLLQRHAPLRGAWLAMLIGGFAEATRLPLLRRLLDDFPGVAAAMDEGELAGGDAATSRRGPLAWLGLLRSAL